uniref:hypothetical protein n=1 Tax=Candidatus Nitrosocosmicus sp. FF01 TaxID=3397670 RepID=UPI0039E9D66F
NITINGTESSNLFLVHHHGGITIVNGQSIITTNNYNSSGNMKPGKATTVMIDLNGVRPDDPRSSAGIVLYFSKKILLVI